MTDDYFSRTGTAESRNDYNASNGMGSGAHGKYQFMPDTWADVARKNPQLNLPFNMKQATPEQQESAMRAFTATNGQALQAGGAQPTPVNLYLAHRFGAQGAQTVLAADPNKPIADLFPPMWAKQNPDMQGVTVAQFVQRAGSRFGDTSAIPQGSADGSGTPLPPQTALNQPNSDPGARYEAAARQAMASGRHDIAVKLAQEAVKAREAMATRDANRTVQTVDLGDSVGIMDPRTGQITQRIPKNKQQAPPNLQHVDLGDVIGVLDPKTGQVVQRIPKGKKPGEGEGGAFAGTGMEAQARSALVRAAKEPGFAQSPEYAAVHSYLSRPRQSFDEARGVMVTLPPEDLSAFPRPSFSGGGQPPPQQAPQPNAAPPPVGPQDFGAPPPPAAPPNMPAVVGQPQGPTVSPVPGLPDKPPTGEQALAAGFADRMADAQSTLKHVAKAGLSNQNRMLDRLPLGAGNLAQSPEYQQFRQARDNFINAQLRRESGAAISPDEYDKADRQYFPMPGDSPEVLVQKERNRQLAVDAMIRNAGQSYRQNPLVGSGNAGSGAPPPPPGFRPL